MGESEGSSRAPTVHSAHPLQAAIVFLFPGGPTAGSQQDSTTTIPEEALGRQSSVILKGVSRSLWDWLLNGTGKGLYLDFVQKGNKQRKTLPSQEYRPYPGNSRMSSGEGTGRTSPLVPQHCREQDGQCACTAFPMALHCQPLTSVQFPVAI